MRGKSSSARRINRHRMWAMTLLPLWVWSLTLVGSPALAQGEIVLGEFFLSGAAINATLELAPVDILNPGVLNGALNQADSNGDGTPDYIQNADAHLELQVRYRRNAPNLGGRVSGEFVPFLRVSVSMTNTTTGETLTFNLLPHVGLAEGWHYASNVDLPGTPQSDTYDMIVRLSPPTGAAKHSDIAGDIEIGSYLDTAVTITLTGVSHIDLNNPDALLGPTAVNVSEDMPAGTFNPRTPTPDADRRLLAQQAIDVLARQAPRPVAAMADQYFQFLQAFTRQVDTTLETPRLNDDIVQALASLRNDIAPDAAAQVVLTTLLRVFFEAAQANLTQVTTADIFEDKTLSPTAGAYHFWDEASVYARALASTVGRESHLRVLAPSRATIGLAPGHAITSGADLGVDDPTFAALTLAPMLDKTVMAAFERGQRAIDNDIGDGDMGDTDTDLTELNVQQQIIRFSLRRGFYIAVLRELDSVLDKLQAGDVSGAEVNRVEAMAFYRILQSAVAQDNAAGSATIEQILAQPVAQITLDNVATILGEFSLAFVNGAIRELNEVNANFLLPGAPNVTQQQRARIVAEETRLFNEIIMDDLAIILGDTFNANGVSDKLDLAQAHQALISAIANSDQAAAAAARLVVDDINRAYITALGGDLLGRLHALTP